MNPQTQQMLRFLCDRAGKSVGSTTTVLWMDVVDASRAQRGGIRLTQSAAGDVVYLRKAGYITMPEPQWEGEPPKADPWVMTYSITKWGLKSLTTEDLDARPKTWRERDQEADNEKRRIQASGGRR